MGTNGFRGFIGMDFDSEAFIHDLRITLGNHYGKNPYFRLLCGKEGFIPDDLQRMDDLIKIPFISTDMFKKSKGFYTRMLLVPPEEIAMWTVSSSTGGDPSIVGRSGGDIDAIRASIKQTGNRHAPHAVDESYMFLPHPATLDMTTPDRVLDRPSCPFVARAAEVWGLTHDDEKNKHYLLNYNPATKGMDLDVKPLIEMLSTGGGKGEILIGGSVPLLHLSLMSIKNQMPDLVPLGERLYVQVGAGGWDGKKGNVNIGARISKRGFIEMLTGMFGIPTDHIFDGYGSSETSLLCAGTYDHEREDFVYEAPGWGRLIVRDPVTFAPVTEPGRRGVPQFITPYGVESVAGVSLLVNDIVEIVDFRPETDGGRGVRFTVVGRLSTSKTDGCGASIARMVEVQ